MSFFNKFKKKTKAAGEKASGIAEGVGEKTVEVGKKVVDKTKTIGEKAVVVAEDVGEKTVAAGKKAVDKTKEVVSTNEKPGS